MNLFPAVWDNLDNMGAAIIRSPKIKVSKIEKAYFPIETLTIDPFWGELLKEKDEAFTDSTIRHTLRRKKQLADVAKISNRVHRKAINTIHKKGKKEI